MRFAAGVLLASLALAAYRPPAGSRFPVRGANGAAILPGGRVLQPLGQQFPTGPGPFKIAIGNSGRSIVTANLGPERSSLTIIETNRKQDEWGLHNVLTTSGERDSSELPSISNGLAFAGDKSVWVSEGDSGGVRLFDFGMNATRKRLNLNRGAISDSFSGDLAFDPARALLYVLDEAHFRLVIFDARKGVELSSAPTGYLPSAISLSPDGMRVWITNRGMFRYHVLPGADVAKPVETGVPFPAFGFSFADKQTVSLNELGSSVALKQIPPIGSVDAPEAGSLCSIDVSNPAKPVTLAFTKTPQSALTDNAGPGSPSSVLATASAIYVADAHHDLIDVIDPATGLTKSQIPLRIQGLENLRGVIPLGMALDETKGWLLVAEAGINAVGVIDIRTNTVIAHLPVGWFPTSIAVRDGQVYVANSKGRGSGPSSILVQPDLLEFGGVFGRGSVSRFPLPAQAELLRYTRLVFAANGFLPVSVGDDLAFPVKHVVVIVKRHRSFDEIFGDLKMKGSEIAGSERLARFGSRGYASGGNARFSLSGVLVTPNQRALAEQFALSDNFYSDGESTFEGRQWLTGNLPDGWTQSSALLASVRQKTFRLNDDAPGRLAFPDDLSSSTPESEEAGGIWSHLSRNHLAFRDYGEGFGSPGASDTGGLGSTGVRLFTNMPLALDLARNTSREFAGANMSVPDLARAAQFIQEVDRDYVGKKKDLPAFLFISLPNDATAEPRPGFPYRTSYVADNDAAVGELVDYLSHSPWWRDMAIFITDADAAGGRDHIDAHRTILLAVGPYFRRRYVSHVNASFPAILKTAFRLFGVPPLTLFDATAPDLSDMMTTTPDFRPYEMLKPDDRLLDPAQSEFSGRDHSPPLQAK